MRIGFLYIVLCVFCFGNAAFAQEETVRLEEIIVEGLPFEKFSSGSKITKSDSIQTEVLSQGTLADYMLQNTTVYMKEQGNNMLASVSFRGTGAAHTAVFWHGINLNSLTLGTSDFNSIPLFLFDEIAVQYGGASSLHGSGAIGGSIHLGSKVMWTPGLTVRVKQDFGSFGNFFSGLKVDVGNGKWISKTRIFNRNLKNDFPYTVTDRLGNTFEIKQQNAEVHNYAVLQEVNGRISKNGFLSLNAWYGNNYHEIQPIELILPDQIRDGEEIKDENFRMVAEYEHFFKTGLLSLGAGYVWDYQLFNNSDLIEAKRTTANLSYEWNLTETTTLRAGGNTQYIVPKVWSYDEDLTEWRGDVFMSANQVIWEKLQINMNVRQTFVPFTTSPIAPSVTASYLIEHDELDITLRAQAERSYRIPTFNDRYWGEQGRSDLKPENGYSYELGQHMVWAKSPIEFELDVAAYYMVVDDWIAWKPAGDLWRPYNLKKVEASGIELNGKLSVPINKSTFDLSVMYAHNRSILLQGVSENDAALGYQLPYTPENRFGAQTAFSYKSYRAALNFNFTSERNGIDVVNEQVPGFMLTDLVLSKNFRLGKQSLSVEGQVLNVFNVSYQNVNRYAMPGRNYLISLNFLINK